MSSPTHSEVERRSETQLALACLVHPWSLLALALLALNDHWWKGVGPAWLTGKLSDLAGLFYFPFLVILLIAFVSGGRSTARTGRFAFWGVGIWFAAAKSIPLVHGATTALAGILVGPVQIVRDPSDALAVTALLPAWLLYKHLATRPTRPLARTLQPAALGIALLLTAATQKPHVPAVHKLMVLEGQLHAFVGDEYDPEDSRGQTFSTPDGIHWKPTPLKVGVWQSHHARTEVSLEGTTIRLADRRVVNAKGQELWGISNDRQDFMRVAGAEDWSAFDIAALPSSPNTLVVALGTEGVVVRSASGSWTRHGVGPAQPTPKRASFEQAMDLVAGGQWTYGVSAIFIAWVLMSFLTWFTLPPGSMPQARTVKPGLSSRLRSLATSPLRALRRVRFDGPYIAAAIAGLVLPCLLFATHLGPVRAGGITSVYWVMVALPFLALSAIPVWLGWRRFKKSGEHRKRSPLKVAFLAGLLALATRVLWDLGWIENLLTASLLALLSLLGVVWLWAAMLGTNEP